MFYTHFSHVLNPFNHVLTPLNYVLNMLDPVLIHLKHVWYSLNHVLNHLNRVWCSVKVHIPLSQSNSCGSVVPQMFSVSRDLSQARRLTKGTATQTPFICSFSTVLNSSSLLTPDTLTMYIIYGIFR